MSLFEPLARLFSSVCLFLWDLLLSIILWGEDKSLPPITDEILLVSASSLAEKIRNRKIKSVDVVAAYINRIKQVNPVLNAVVHERFSEALKEAEEADQLADTSSPKKLAKEKPLLGIPFTTKDSVAIKGLHQDVGVVARRDVVAAEDADVVTLLRQAGAIPLALTNVPELCMWVESYNNIHGVCNNPYKTHRIAGGSSGGEGSIIGSAGSVLGIGTDLGGSIRIPSFCCGIFGHKPSSGVVSNEGLFPVFGEGIKAINTTGPMVRYACDLLPVLKVIAGPKLHLLKLGTKVDFSKIKIFYQEDNGSFPAVVPEIKQAIRKAVSFFQKEYELTPVKLNQTQLKNGCEMWFAKVTLMECPPLSQEFKLFKGDLNPRIEFLKWLFRCSEHTYPVLMLCASEKAAPGINSPVTINFSKALDDLDATFQDVLGDNGVFIYPVCSEPALLRYGSFARATYFSYTCPFNVLGYPSTAVPMGLNHSGVPVGFQVVATKYNDHLCIAVAEELEKAFGGWRSPSPVATGVSK